MGNIQSTPPPSSTTINDVFLSFRGENTRDTFTSHLYDALCRKDIKTFIDNEVEKGDTIWPNLQKNIRESKISVVIFSKDYASSKWCLRELLEIMECKEKNGQTVIPVFYSIDPSHVRKQIGSFEDSFVNHDKEFQEESPKWRKALTEASNLTGWDSAVTKPESVLVKDIVEDISKKLMSKYTESLGDFKGLVGIDKQLEQVMSLLCPHNNTDIRIVGIWGMGGIGKTTIADAIFNSISSQFNGKCFLQNVRERLEMSGGLVSLQEEFLSKVLNDEGNIKLDGLTFPENIKKKLRIKKIFIVLDDVDNFKQLDILSRGLDQFGPGSRIMMTSRNRHVLRNCIGNDHNIYEVKGLNVPKALELFCNFAFKNDHPTDDLTVLSRKIVHYSKGNPLALKVLGSLLFEKDKELWESATADLQTHLDGEIFDVLKISYDGLKEEEKDLFLDIACFFNWYNKEDVVKLHGDSCSYLLSVLEDKSLITVGVLHGDNYSYLLSVLEDKSLIAGVGRSGTIKMHDLLQEMGRKIVDKESNRPGNRSRLWKQEDVLDTLKNGDGMDAVQGMVLHMDRMVEDIDLSPLVFQNMKNLRFIKFWTYNNMPSKCKIRCPNGDLIYLSSQLRSLYWSRCPLKELPSTFKPNNLIHLDLASSSLKRLWEDTVRAPKLKRLILKGSRQLTSISKCLDAPLLEEIDLENCEELHDFPSPVKDVHDLNQLRVLNLRGCKSLEQLPSEIHCKSLISLDIRGCINLKRIPNLSKASLLKSKILEDCKSLFEFPRLPQHLQNPCRLILDGWKNLKQLPSEILCESLRSLDLEGCINLKRIPDLSKASLLEKISFKDCESLLDIPQLAQHLPNLYQLNLQGCKNLKLLPSEIYCESLRSLNLSGCINLKRIPDLSKASLLVEIIVENCESLLYFPQLAQHFPNLYKLNLQGCKNLKLLPSEIYCESLGSLNLSGCSNLKRISDLSKASLLEEIIFKDCESLLEFPLLAQHLPNLYQLNLDGCKNLKSFPSDIHFESLPSLNLSGYNNLTKFPQISGSITELNLSRTAIDEVPSSIQNLVKLSKLDLSKCTSLKLISTDICKLKSLQMVNFRNCFKLMSFPEILDTVRELDMEAIYRN